MLIDLTLPKVILPGPAMIRSLGCGTHWMDVAIEGILGIHTFLHLCEAWMLGWLVAWIARWSNLWNDASLPTKKDSHWWLKCLDIFSGYPPPHFCNFPMHTFLSSSANSSASRIIFSICSSVKRPLSLVMVIFSLLPVPPLFTTCYPFQDILHGSMIKHDTVCRYNNIMQ